eukprot:5689860-Pyramimonas_sp.AAC.1
MATLPREYWELEVATVSRQSSPVQSSPVQSEYLRNISASKRGSSYKGGIERATPFEARGASKERFVVSPSREEK